MWVALLSLLILGYFIRDQFEYARPTRLRYWVLPVYSVVMVTQLFHPSTTNYILAGGLLIGGLIIGVLQGKYAVIRPLIGSAGEWRVEVRGGWPYLIGWGAMLVIQFVVTAALLHHAMSVHEVFTTARESLLEEIVPIIRFKQGGLWALWLLSASSGLAYTLMLIHRSPEFKETIARHAHGHDRRAVRKRH